MSKSRRELSLRNLRDALKLCRSGIDPITRESNPCQHKDCKGKPSSDHDHAFLCCTRKRKPQKPEGPLRDDVEHDVKNYLRTCRAALQVSAQRLTFLSRFLTRLNH